MVSKKIKSAYYPLTILGVGIVGMGIFYAISSSLVKTMAGMLSFVFAPKGTQLTTIEMQPLLFPSGNLSFNLAWGNFTTTFFLALISLVVLIYFVVKQGNSEKSLLAVWTLVIFAVTLGQRRFAYYLAVNVALLTGYLSWLIVAPFLAKDSAIRAMPKSKATPRRKAIPQKRGFHITVSQVNMSLALLIFFLVLFAGGGAGSSFANIFVVAQATASQVQYAPSDAWSSSMDWLKANSPEPLGNPDLYYQSEKDYEYTKSVYGVLSWWDYGYWITRMAHRIPNANPGQDPKAQTSVASFFTSQDEASANKITQALKSSYVVIDFETATGKFWAIAMYAGTSQNEFFEQCWVPKENNVKLYFYPEYFRSLCARLYSFDGKAVTPQNSAVISYQERKTTDGMVYKEIISETQFTTYEEANTYIQNQKSGNYKIVSTNPLSSPVPLEALGHYKLVHSSENSIQITDMGTVPEVKIFQYTD